MLDTIEGKMPSRGRRGAKARERRRLTALMTLAAVLLQLLVSAWHVHPDDFAFLTQRGADNALENHAQSPPIQPGVPGHGDCVLCATLHLAAGSLLPDATGGALPGARRAPPLALPEALHLSSAPYLLFRTRAPPVA